MCHHKLKVRHTSLQSMKKPTSLISALSDKVEKLISEIFLYCLSGCLFYPSHTYIWYAFMFSCSYQWCSRSASVLHTQPQVWWKYVYVYAAVSETPHFCLMLHLGVFMLECVCFWFCVCASSCACLSHCISGMAQSSWKDADKVKAKKWDRDQAKSQNEKERERERESQFQFN